MSKNHDIIEDLFAMNTVYSAESHSDIENVKTGYEMIVAVVKRHHFPLLCRFIRCMQAGNGDVNTEAWVSELDDFLASVWLPECANRKIDLEGLNIKTALKIANDEIATYNSQIYVDIINRYSKEEVAVL